ncbi:MAG: hypothetical protein AB7G62_15865 [Magnetospirillum sp.]
MRVATLAASLMMICTVPAMAQELPKFPKAGPPGSLPEANCDTALPNNGGWLLGRWVSPHSRWEFIRQGDGMAWILDRKGSVDDGMGWSAGTRIEGAVTALSACSFTLGAGDGQFTMDGVLTDGGKIYGVASNAKGNTARFLLRRER